MGIKTTFVCVTCDETVTKENCSGKYCSNKCQQQYQKNKIISEWKKDHKTALRSGYRIKKTIRDYIFDKYDSKCAQCGWNSVNPISNKIPLEIDHIDGDCTNNTENNLRLLCPNCHSLTPNYRALNAGKGNRKRLQYSKLI